MKHFKKTAVSLLSAAVTAVLLAGCAKKPDSNIIMEMDTHSRKAPSVSITFFGYQADAVNLVAIEDALHDFMDINPGIRVTYEGIKGQTYWDAFERRAASGNLDDIFTVDHDHLMALKREGRLEDLSDLSTIGNFDTLARSQFTEEDGSVYFLPISISTYGLYVNLDLLRQNGMEAPADLPEFTQACDYFVSQGIVPIIVNNYNSLRSLIVAKGMYPVYRKKDPVAEIRKFNSREADLAETLRPGVELVDMMLERGWIDREEALETAQTSDDLDLFAKGDRPFMVSGGWATPLLSDRAPGFDYAVYPLPVLDDDSVLVMNMSTCISINAESEHMDEVKQFAEYLTQADVMWHFCDSQQIYTPLKDDRMPSDPVIAPSAPGLSEGRIVMGSDYNLDLSLDSVLRECSRQMLEGMDVDEAMVFLADQIVSGKYNSKPEE